MLRFLQPNIVEMNLLQSKQRVILELGTASAILSLMSKTEVLKFNLLCKRMYLKVIPSLTNQTSVDFEPIAKTWLDWITWTGTIKRCLNVTISG